MEKIMWLARNKRGKIEPGDFGIEVLSNCLLVPIELLDLINFKEEKQIREEGDLFDFVYKYKKTLGVLLDWETEEVLWAVEIIKKRIEKIGEQE